MTTVSPAASSAVDLSAIRSLLSNSLAISLLGPGELILIRDVEDGDEEQLDLRRRSWCHIHFGAMHGHRAGINKQTRTGIYCVTQPVSSKFWLSLSPTSVFLLLIAHATATSAGDMESMASRTSKARLINVVRDKRTVLDLLAYRL